jgi:formamidopyrimidine-DNA glycosylase
MPELPEVEYVARQLRDRLVGRRFAGVRVLWDRAVAGTDPRAFEAALVGRRVTGVGRRGKHLLIALDDGDTLVVHRRMSGNLVFSPPAPPDEPYVRVAFDLDDGRRLLYTDPRKFGRLALLSPAAHETSLAALGPEPLDEEFTPQALAERLRGRDRALKALLLDQSVIAGLGNIYADEALYRARLHPLRAGSSLSEDEVAALYAGIRGALETGIAHGGTTFGRHRDVDNEAGTNLEHVEVYRRTGQPCPRCGTPIARIAVAQRGTHYCPNCQRLP